MATRLGCILSIFALGACSGGGGITGMIPAGTSTTSNTTTTTQPFVTTVAAPEGPSLNGNSLPQASGTTPNFSTSIPANGTTFPLDEAVMKITFGPNQASVIGYSNSLIGGATLTLQGTATISNSLVPTRNVFELKVPSLSLDAQNIVSGSFNTLPDGRELRLQTSTLNYSLLGAWEVVTRKPGASLPDSSYWGIGFTGYQTPTSAIPSSGAATYTTGKPVGDEPLTGLLVPGGGVVGITSSSLELTGQASIDVNFGTGKVNGSLFNMTSACCDFDAEPWNNVALTGALSGATMQGTTSVTSVPPGKAALSSSATGTFTGALFGPNAQELGLSWTLYDPSGDGKSAIGVVGATTP